MKIIILLPVLILTLNCSQKEQVVKSLRHYDFNEKGKEYYLDPQLREISGLAFIDGHLYAHNDEKGIVYILNTEGAIIDQFHPGIRPFKKDFEGIAAAGNLFYLITSAGVIYKFEKSDSTDSPYDEIKTPLNNKFDIEGLCYDQDTNSLLIVCKDYPQKNEKNIRPVFSFDLSTGKLINKPRFIISLDELKEKFGINNFSPSGIEKHPDGSFYIISSLRKAVAVYSPDGELLEAVSLPSKHMQPEGITFLPDKDMVISDEGGKDDAEITIYSYKASDK